MKSVMFMACVHFALCSGVVVKISHRHVMLQSVISPTAELEWFRPEVPDKVIEKLIGSIDQEANGNSTSSGGVHMSMASAGTGISITWSGVGHTAVDHNFTKHVEGNITANPSPNESSMLHWSAAMKDDVRIASTPGTAAMPPRKTVQPMQMSLQQSGGVFGGGAPAAFSFSTCNGQTISRAQLDSGAHSKVEKNLPRFLDAHSLSESDVTASAAAINDLADAAIAAGGRRRWNGLALRQALTSIEKLSDGVEKQRLLRRARECAEAVSVVRCYYACH